MLVFSTKKEDQCHLIKCPEHLDATMIKQFELYRAQWQEQPVSLHIFDWHYTKDIDESFFRVFGQFKAGLKARRIAVCSVRVSLKLLMLFRSKGVEELFSPYKDVDTACEAHGISLVKTPKIDVKFMNPFFSSISMFFQESKKVELKMAPMRIRKEDSLISQGLIGTLNLSSSSFKGSLRFSFDKKVAIGLYNAIENKNIEDINEDVALYKLNFMETVFSNAEKSLREAGYSDVIHAYPNLFEVDSGAVSLRSQKEISILVEYMTSFGKFFVEIVAEG